jgi:hypothetical protein
MSRSAKSKKKRRTRSRADQEVRTFDVPLDVCTDAVRRVLAQELGGAAVEEPTTGFFTWTEGTRFRKERYTLRTYASMQGTRVSFDCRSETSTSPWVMLLFALVLVGTAGLGILFVLPFLHDPTSERRREIAMFRLLRTLEAALVPSPGSYRVASGALLNVPPPPSSHARVAERVREREREEDEPYAFEGDDEPFPRRAVRRTRRG